jgi:hypothetical protein
MAGDFLPPHRFGHQLAGLRDAVEAVATAEGGLDGEWMGTVWRAIGRCRAAHEPGQKPDGPLLPPQYRFRDTQTGRPSVVAGYNIVNDRTEERSRLLPRRLGIFSCDVNGHEARLLAGRAGVDLGEGDAYGVLADRLGLKIDRDTLKLSVLMSLFGAGPEAIAEKVSEPGQRMAAIRASAVLRKSFLAPETVVLDGAGKFRNPDGRVLKPGDPWKFPSYYAQSVGIDSFWTRLDRVLALTDRAEVGLVGVVFDAAFWDASREGVEQLKRAYAQTLFDPLLKVHLPVKWSLVAKKDRG